MLPFIQLLYLTLYLTSEVLAMPLRKREIVTRVHTASTTNTVTNFFSTTTQVIIAPTVQVIISGDTTLFSTMVGEGGDINAEPTTTITSIIQVKRVSLANEQPTATSTTPMLDSSSSSATTTSSAISSDITTTSTPSSSSIPTTTPSSSSSSSSSIQSSSIRFASQVVNLENVEANQNQQKQEEQRHVHNTAHISTPVVEMTTTTSSSSTTTLEPTASQSSTSNNNADTTIKSAPIAIAYSPYNNDGTCKSADQVKEDLQLIKSKGINQIRMYGTDCNSLQTVLPNAKSIGLSVNQGLWITSSGVDSIDIPLQQLINYGQTNGWDVFAYITVGNEAVISQYCSVSDLVSKIGQVRGQLKAAGYTGQLTTSEPPVTYEQHPELCTASGIDFVGINPHAYFDTYSSADTAGSFVKGQIELVQKACGTGNIVVTETGYPSAGIQNGGNIPSKPNQLIAIQKILEATNNQVTLLSCFNDFWKAPGPYGIEQYFGILDNLP